MMRNSFTVKFEKQNIILGIILIFLGIIFPLFFHVHNFRIYDLLFKSLHNRDKGALLLAAFKLVSLNSIRGIPHYLGTFIIAESTDLSLRGRRVPHFKGLFALLIIPSVYSTINRAHNIRYDFGVPALIVIFAIMYLEKMDFTNISLPKKAFIIILLLFGVQWLDVIPAISLFGFGRGETSQDLKTIADMIGARDVLSVFAIVLCCIFSFNAVLVTKLINDEHRLILTTEKNKRVERELHEARIKALQARNYIELKNLVHDLKTPLTSSQALVSVLKMMDDSSDPKKALYLEKIENSLDRLSDMISEILYEDKRLVINTSELINYVLSHISHLKLASKISYENKAESAFINVNKIRFARAIINALDNSYKAIDKENGGIHIEVTADDCRVYFRIIDDGIGIREEVMEEIVERGFSLSNSTGFGLSFINEVVKSHGGSLEIDSEYGKGTCIKLSINRVM